MSNRRMLLWASAAALLLSNGAVRAEEEDEEDEEDEVEEIIVTGSLIPRDNFDIPSPMDVLTEVDLELAATPDLGDIIFDQTFQIGVNAYSAPFEFGGGDDQNWQQGGEVWANLRGLGTRATMTMMDGHRVPANVTGYSWWTRRAGTDVTNLYPGPAIGRVETLLDGASALYGSEAVSGVINLIPRKNFEGLEVSYEWQQPMEKGAPQRRLGLLAGAQGERTSAIFALEIRDVERMKLTDRPDYIQSSANWTGQYLPTYNETPRGNPGDWAVPNRDASGNLRPYSGNNWHQIDGQWFDRGAGGGLMGDGQGRVAGRRQVDPGCGTAFGAGANSLPLRYAIDPDGDDPLRTVDPDNPVDGLAVTDHAAVGSFLNGYMTGDNRGLSRWRGSEGSANGGSGERDDCRQVMADWQDIQQEQDSQSAMAYFDHQFNDYLSIHGEFVASSMDFNTRDIPGDLDEWDRRSIYSDNVAIAIGSNPGNPFRAFADGSNGFAADGSISYVDANGNGRYDYGVERGEWFLFAQDANGDGFPDRDLDGDGLADAAEADQSARDPRFRVVLLPLVDDAGNVVDSDGDGIPDRFDHDTVGNGGVRLFEDVRLISMTITPKQPYNNTVRWLNDDMTYSRRRQIDNYRLRLGASLNVPDTDWLVDADWIWATSKREEDYAEPVWPWAVASMRCAGGQFGDTCWNPFSTAWLATDADGQILPAWRDPDDDAANTELENRYAGVSLRHDQRNIGTYIVDVVASNTSLFDLWWNDAPVGFAAGIHWRLESEEYRPNQLGVSALGSARTNFQYTEEQTQAVFAELQLPLIQHEKWGEMELQLAMRYAEFEGRGSISTLGEVARFDTTIPKVALRYSPTDWLAIRASLTEGFVLPGMFQLFQATVRPDNYATVRDYICDEMPELLDCAEMQGQGSMPNVLVADARNVGLGAEVSDLWNAGVSVRMFDGDLVMDVDYTTVDFNGRVERLGAGQNLSANSFGFDSFVRGRCGEDTLLDYDNPNRFGPDGGPPGEGFITPRDFIEMTSQAELDCRLAAAQAWVADFERGIGNTIIERGGDTGLRLEKADNPWLNQGQQRTTTMIYAMRYRFDASDLPFVNSDFGSFEWRTSATHILELSLKRYAEDSGHDYALLGPIDGVGNRNNGVHYLPQSHPLYVPLPATPEWRVNMGLRWFRDNHTAQLSVRWHEELRDVIAAWDELKEYGESGLWACVGIPAAACTPELMAANSDPFRFVPEEHNGLSTAEISESEACADQDRNPFCNIDSRHYWDFSYTYRRPNVMGLGYLSLNVAVRNIFGTKPDAIPSGAGYDAYVDNIMGRIAFARLSVGF